MSARDEFLKNAAECARMAEKTHNPVDKAAWQRLSESWHRLAQEADEPFAPRAPDLG
jgi:hypothetical protein